MNRRLENLLIGSGIGLGKSATERKEGESEEAYQLRMKRNEQSRRAKAKAREAKAEGKEEEEEEERRPAAAGAPRTEERKEGESDDAYALRMKRNLQSRRAKAKARGKEFDEEEEEDEEETAEQRAIRRGFELRRALRLLKEAGRVLAEEREARPKPPAVRVLRYNWLMSVYEVVGLDGKTYAYYPEHLRRYPYGSEIEEAYQIYALDTNADDRDDDRLGNEVGYTGRRIETWSDPSRKGKFDVMGRPLEWRGYNVRGQIGNYAHILPFDQLPQSPPEGPPPKGYRDDRLDSKGKRDDRGALYALKDKLNEWLRVHKVVTRDEKVKVYNPQSKKMEGKIIATEYPPVPLATIQSFVAELTPRQQRELLAPRLREYIREYLAPDIPGLPPNPFYERLREVLETYRTSVGLPFEFTPS